MVKLAILKIGDGSFEQGFTVNLRLSEAGAFNATEIEGFLPPAPAIPELYEQWQKAYVSLGNVRKIKPGKVYVNNYSLLDLAGSLEVSISDWLNSSSKDFQPIRDRLLETFIQNTDEVRLLVQTKDECLRRLPWHLWDLLNRYPQVEVALGYPEYEPVNAPLRKTQVRILAILGTDDDSDNNSEINQKKRIDVEADLKLLQQSLLTAEIVPLINPKKEQLSQELWDRNWDILFFAGHSSSESGKGEIYINPKEVIEIEELKKGLKSAIDRGLRLAIFNSCDGLGLANDLAKLQMPFLIVMREKIPDEAAQKFLEFFLQSFAIKRKSLYASVREAREKLEELKAKYICANWLPVICQNPACNPPTWQDFLDNNKLAKLHLRDIFFSSLAITSVVLIARFLGLLQPLELKVFDFFLGLRPSEQTDSRLLIVKVREEDLKQYRHPLPDTVLGGLIAKLDRYQPRAIGLDIYRDRPINYSDVQVLPGIKSFLTQAQQNSRLISICKVSSNSDTGISHLEGIPLDNLGYSNSVEDSDRVIRRHLLWQTPPATSPCLADYALSVILAFKYLEIEGIKPEFNADGDLQLKDTVFKDLPPHTGMYQNYDDGGQQVIINYRKTDQIAPEVTLLDIINDRVKPDLIKNKIILIGVTATSIKDDFMTPLGEMRGLRIHAQMTSQILSAVLDKRQLLSFMPWWEDALWIGFWSFTGGAIAWKTRSHFQKFTYNSTALIILASISWFGILSGLILPVFPATVAFGTTGIVLIYLPRSRLKKISIITALAGSTGIGFSTFQLGWILPIVPATVSLVAAATVLLISRLDLPDRLKLSLYQLFNNDKP